MDLLIKLFIILTLTYLTISVVIKEESKKDDKKDYYSPPNFNFKYGVEDPHTGDNKNQWEHRRGDKVEGRYQIYQPDGTKLVVDYKSDKHVGFNTNVKRIGHAKHPYLYGHEKGKISNYGKGEAESYIEINMFHR